LTSGRTGAKPEQRRQPSEALMPPVPPTPYSLFLDVDGTLIDIAPRPDAVVVPDGLKQNLAGLAEQLGGALALVSGRTIADLDRLFDPLRLRASGVHGAEMRQLPGGTVESSAGAMLPQTIIAALHDLAKGHPGTLVENKRYSAAIHYRAVPAAGPVLGQHLKDLLARLPVDDLRILPGHMVFEVKRAGFDKGRAVGAFLRLPPFIGRTPIFVGDDVTDEPGFDAVQAAGGMAYAVGEARRGASPVFGSPSQVRAWIADLNGNTA
jgi:trehalose 6-phosphate phosphatase